jgi:leucine rich repeat protein
MAMLWSSLAAHAQDEWMIKFHTNVPEKAKNTGVTAQVSFVLGSKSDKADVYINYGSGDTEVEIKKAIVENDKGELAIKGTLCTGVVSDAGWVTISGDPNDLYFFNASGNEIDKIEFNPNLKLQVLNLEHNVLTSLNIDRLQSLNVIYLQDNPFSATTPLMIGKMPELIVLEVPQIGHISPNFTLKNFPKLRSFDAYHTIGLKVADPTGCPNLQRLSLDMTSVESVDLSKNPELEILNVGDSRVKTLDLRNNPKITQLYISHSSGTVNTDVKFESIDVSHCPELYYFYCGGNNLKELNLRNNPKLFTLSCDRNLLRKLDVSQNPILYSVNVRYNYMDFATLPEPGNWFEYYHEQNPMELNDTYKVGDVIDLSNRVLRPKTTTQARLFRVPKADPTKPVELDDSYYSYENGKVTLKKELDEEVFVQFNNSRLKDYPIRTENFRVKTVAEFGKDVKAIQLASLGDAGSPLKMSVGILGATAANPVTVKVDLGDGNTTPFEIKDERPATANIVTTRTGAGDIIVYVPQDKYVTSLESDGQYIDNIDLSALTELRTLTLKRANLTTIDLSYNNKLEKLDLSQNQLRRVDLRGPSSYFNKSKLSDINVSYNQIDSLLFNTIYGVTKLNVSHNKLNKLDLKDADNLRMLDISHNKFTRLLLNHSELIEDVNVSNNELTEVKIPPVAPIKKLNVSGNYFTLANMPNDFGLTRGNFIYAPQHVLQISTSSPGIDLSEQNITKNGATTNFVWKKKDGSSLQLGKDYTITNGSAKFINLALDSIYCEMTHPAYPDFEGQNVFKTTNVHPIAFPKYELASFTTVNQTDSVVLSLASYIPGKSVYFEWGGNGNVTQYTLGDKYKIFQAKSKANTKVRVLVAEADDKVKVFSVANVNMTDVDLTGLKEAKLIAVTRAGLTSIKLPAAPNLTDLNLEGNELTDINLSAFPKLNFISLTGNKIKTFDLSQAPNLGIAYLSSNKMKEIKLNNPKLWNLDLSDNDLESVSLDKLPMLEQLWLNANKLTKVDVSKNTNLTVLNVVGNRLKFSTMPLPSNNGKPFNRYSYNLQAPIDVKCVNGKVDLSSEAVVGGEMTTYHWFIGNVTYRDGELQGEKLELNEEYTLENGVTTLKLDKTFTNLVCVMANDNFPNALIYTNYITFTPATGIDAVTADKDVKIQFLDGAISVLGAQNSTVAIYSIDGKLVYQGKVADDSSRIPLGRGTYIVRVGNKAAKVSVK